jgi:hypothetical protein
MQRLGLCSHFKKKKDTVLSCMDVDYLPCRGPLRWLLYSFRPMLSFANTNVFRHILVLDISVFTKGNMSRREWKINVRPWGVYICRWSSNITCIWMCHTSHTSLALSSAACMYTMHTSDPCMTMSQLFILSLSLMIWLLNTMNCLAKIFMVRCWHWFIAKEYAKVLG